MLELNVKFQEKYKQLDLLCKDIFSSKEGVSEYIKEMENTNSQFSRYILDWANVYKQLKHMRWLRNQLAHEVGAFNFDLCSDYDLKWLNDFYNSILNRTDPLAQVGQLERQKQLHQNNSNSNKTQINIKTKVSLWDKIKAKFKSWFS